MAYGDDIDRRERAVSALGALCGAGVLAAGLLYGIRDPIARHADALLAVVSLNAPVPEPPAPEPVAHARATPREEGAAAPPNRTAQASAVVAPPPVLPTPAPAIAAEVAGRGSDADAGAAPTPGPGSGAGGQGQGTGAGRGGDGTGGGGGGARARYLSGTISNRDYPTAASRANIGGSVSVRFTVGADGRVRGCGVMRSSGNADLDSTTCRLIERRFRYAPARNAAGQAIESVQGWRQDWWLEGRDNR
jgi:protein TonB